MKQKNEPTKAKTDTSPTLPGMTPHDQSRRTLEGHTRPCEDCGAVNWVRYLSWRNHMRRLRTGGRKTSPTRAPNGPTETTARTVLVSVGP